jgi:glucose/arabinose dehydrogenase/lysophospholipase L1-like esterase
MSDYGHFETGLHQRFPEHDLFIRNIARDGNTPSFRPHSGRENQLGFPGAEEFHHPYTGGNIANGIGHRETEEEWLRMLQPDILIAFFGFNESFQGDSGIENFRAELDAFVKHTVAQPYNGVAAPQLILVSPSAYQDLTEVMDVPDGVIENERLAAYTEVMQAVAEENSVSFVNAFEESQRWFRGADEPLTTDGARLNDAGYALLSDFLIDEVFGGTRIVAEDQYDQLHAAVMEKHWFWTMDYKIPNGIHVFGQRYNPFGPENYPFEIEKVRQMTANRDRAVWAAARGEAIDVAALDRETLALPGVPSNYNVELVRDGSLDILPGEESVSLMTVPEGYRVELFASEEDFPELKNPVQMAFDNRGRLWVATLPTYPHWRPGDPHPEDKILILEDTDADGRADKLTVWADSLHLPIGFAFAPEGVYVTQGINLVLLSDTDGDDRADRREIVLSGFDDHDTHHGISAYATDPSGAIYMGEGEFLRTNVETAYGPVRATNGGFYRFNPQRRQLERHAQIAIPNPWGIAFDDWGQHFFIHTSSPPMEWMLTSSIRPSYGVHSPRGRNLVGADNGVRPTSGLEIVSSRHFPDEVQGDILLANNIGFLGIKQRRLTEDGTGYASEFRQDLLQSDERNFRPVDLEFAPDGSLNVIDWHNPLIGHMQHNARDPNRDHAHGRVFRITYPSRPLVVPPPVHGASIGQLLENLKLHELRARDRTRRELRGRDADEVIAALDTWVAGLDASDPNHEHHLLEALWVTWGLNRVDADLLRRVLASEDHRARAAAVQVARYTGHQVPDRVELLRQAANDEHGRVRLGAVVAASWLDGEEGLSVLAEVEAEQAEDLWLSAVFQRAGMTLRGEQISNPSRQLITPP